MSVSTQPQTVQSFTPVPLPLPTRTPQRQPRYHVVLLDDNDHTYPYVIGMLGKLFGYPREESMLMAAEVDTIGRVIIDTTTLEHAELKRDQVHTFGRDWRIDRCQGSMTCILEATGG